MGRDLTSMEEEGKLCGYVLKCCKKDNVHEIDRKWHVILNVKFICDLVIS